MRTFVENNTENICSFIFSLIYLVKSLRNNNISHVEYTKTLDYIDPYFKNKIYMNGDIIYVKDWENWDVSLKKKYSKNQKWIINNFFDDDGIISYKITPYFENKILSVEKKLIIITSDRILPISSEVNFNDSINNFREKYENQFLFIIIYLCFLNCFPIINNSNPLIINTLVLNDYFFIETLKYLIEINKSIFLDLNFEISNTIPNINNIIKRIYISIFKTFAIDNHELCDAFKNKNLSYKNQSEIMNMITNYKIQFVNNDLYSSYSVQTDVSSYYKKYNLNKFPDLPGSIKFKYINSFGKNNTRESINLNLLNYMCKAFNIQSDPFLSVIKCNFNICTNSVISFQEKKLQSGLNLSEIVNIRQSQYISYPEISVRTGGKKTKKNKLKRIKKSKTKKIYKGGTWDFAYAALAKAGTICYVNGPTAVALINAGIGEAVAGGGKEILGRLALAGSVQIVITGTTTASTAVATTAAVGAAAVSSAPVVIVGAALTGLVYAGYYLMNGNKIGIDIPMSQQEPLFETQDNWLNMPNYNPNKETDEYIKSEPNNNPNKETDEYINSEPKIVSESGTILESLLSSDNPNKWNTLQTCEYVNYYEAPLSYSELDTIPDLIKPINPEYSPITSTAETLTKLAEPLPTSRLQDKPTYDKPIELFKPMYDRSIGPNYAPQSMAATPITTYEHLGIQPFSPIEPTQSFEDFINNYNNYNRFSTSPSSEQTFQTEDNFNDFTSAATLAFMYTASGIFIARKFKKMKGKEAEKRRRITEIKKKNLEKNLKELLKKRQFHEYKTEELARELKRKNEASIHQSLKKKALNIKAEQIFQEELANEDSIEKQTDRDRDGDIDKGNNPAAKIFLLQKLENKNENDFLHNQGGKKFKLTKKIRKNKKKKQTKRLYKGKKNF